MIVERAEGRRETLIDVPYDFTNQITYETDMVLKPGDSLVTTCHVQNDTDRLIKERSSTEEEMCMNGLTAWPSGSLYANTVDDGGIGCLSERAAGRMALRSGRVVSLVFRPRPDLWAVSYSEIFVRRAHLSVDLCGVRS